MWGNYLRNRGGEEYMTKKCLKCGGIDIDIRYISGDKSEYLARKCLKCGFTWREDCLDKNKEE